MNAVLVVLCGGLGALARFGVDALVERRLSTEYPLGTLVVNLSGSFLLGLMVGLGTGARAQLLLGTATLGSYTTFSTWILESHRSAEDGESRLAARQIAIALAAGLASAAVGRALGRAV